MRGTGTTEPVFPSYAGNSHLDSSQQHSSNDNTYSPSKPRHEDVSTISTSSGRSTRTEIASTYVNQIGNLERQLTASRKLIDDLREEIVSLRELLECQTKHLQFYKSYNQDKDTKVSTKAAKIYRGENGMVNISQQDLKLTFNLHVIPYTKFPTEADLKAMGPGSMSDEVLYRLNIEPKHHSHFWTWVVKQAPSLFQQHRSISQQHMKKALLEGIYLFSFLFPYINLLI